MSYARAPPNMKAAVFSICLFMSTLSALVEMITPFTEDPNLPGYPLFFQTTVFWIRYRDVDEKFTTYEDAGVEEVNVHHYAVEGKNSRSEDEKRSRWRLEDV
ncbi:hypothetical protein B0H19DRAFT_1386894 [Mycena capillaripes]|nr:hypothetical protein B0H19DRAFT_1386894 [Mycena capillaripes]